MKAVLLTGAGIAVVDGVALGVALGIGNTVVAATTLAVGLVSAVVLAWLTPAPRVPERALVTLGGRPAPEPAEPEPAEPEPELAPAAVPAPAAVTAPVEPEPEPVLVARHALPTPAAA